MNHPKFFARTIPALVAALMAAGAGGLLAPGGVALADDVALDRGHAEALERDLVRVAADATPRTVCVFGVIGLGSGAFVDAAGTVVTNAHVAAGARYAVVQTSDGARLLYRCRGIDFGNDLAVLEPVEKRETPAPYFELSTDRPAIGAPLLALGFPGGPRGADPHPTVTFGEAIEGGGIGPVMGVLDYSAAIRTDVPIFSGNSGGPLVDMAGRLVGLNGAVEFTRANGLAVPAALVKERLPALVGGVVRLPSGRVIDPRTSILLRFLYSKLDPYVRALQEAREHAPRGETMVPDSVARALPGKGDPEAASEFLKRTLGAARNRLLRGAFEFLDLAPRASLLVGDEASGRTGFATPIGPREIVACASAFGADVKEISDPHRRFRVVARVEELDLILARAESGPDLEPARDSDGAPVGTLVAVVGPEGPLGAGIVSAAGRPISEATARLLAAGEGLNVADRVIDAVKGLAERLGAKDVAELLEQLESQRRLARAFSAGSNPRAFAVVLSHDAPCGPEAAGAPLLDLRGRLVAIHVATAHFGTSYAVPIAAARAAFAKAAGERAPRTEPRRGPREGQF